MTGAPSGYLHGDYARSLGDFGQPRLLSRAQGWLLARAIPATSQCDAIGCYPLFCCSDWTGLSADLAELQDLVSASLVADPFGNHDVRLLRECFPDVMIPFKHHFVADLSRDPSEFVAKHHQRNARYALDHVEMERCVVPTDHAMAWSELYDNLIRRHSIEGIAAFSPLALRSQLAIPGIEMFRAVIGAQTVGAVLWMVQNQIAYYHLAAYSEAGYDAKASFGLFWTSLHYFSGKGVRWLSFGGGPSVREGEDNGLVRFKRGWSTGTRMAYFCGRILNPAAYASLAKSRSATNFFPAYRQHERE